ncbi:hypothetical protein EZV73_07915 [Acidaminobacter sp. JC074]|uniref:zinc-ribbon domain-containing protein n=1 Tax=Acidaminobacter sp. JC074 TaxID=2530199 RepID=UPI001F102EE9|nr:zinc ribbon domain-containing protein [Acidaminobacter sp. JC074]MCH4887493.1 hypothetical protein [Acidaminobacter sp. JC074]
MRNMRQDNRSPVVKMLSAAFGIVFAFFWTGTAVRMGAPKFFVLFGVFFIGMSIYQFVTQIKHLTKKRHKVSESLDDDNRQVEALLERDVKSPVETKSYNFCPECGEQLKKKYKRCPACGDKL